MNKNRKYFGFSFPSFFRFGLFGFCLAFVLNVIFLYLTTIRTNSYEFSDFLPFILSAEIFSKEKDNLYVYETQVRYQAPFIARRGSVDFNVDRLWPYNNPPTFLAPFILVKLFDPQTGYRMIQGSILIVLFLSILLFIWRFPGTYRIIFSTALIFGFSPVMLTILNTQSSITTLFLLTSIFLFMEKKRYILAGFLASLLLYKPHFLIPFFLYFFVTKQWKSFVGLFTGCIGTIGAWMIVSPKSFLDFFQFGLNNAKLNEILQVESGPMISFQGFFFQLQHYFGFAIDPLFTSSVVSVGFLIFVTIFWWKYKDLKEDLYSTIPLVLLIGTGHVHMHDGVLLLFPMFYWLYNKSKYIKIFTITGWVIFLVSYFSPFYPQPFPLISTLFMLSALFAIFWEIRSKRIVLQGKFGDNTKEDRLNSPR